MQKIAVLPQWPGPWKKWARNFCYTNQWRVADVIGGIDDCEAECALVWVECCNRYGGTVTSPQHMMALYKLSVISWFNDCSVKNTKIRTYREANEDAEEPLIKGDGEALVALDEASSELKDVLKIFFNAPQEIMDVLRTDARNCSPLQFFKKIARHVGLSSEKALELSNELQDLLR